jgi:hypothetical protein
MNEYEGDFETNDEDSVRVWVAITNHNSSKERFPSKEHSSSSSYSSSASKEHSSQIIQFSSLSKITSTDRCTILTISPTMATVLNDPDAGDSAYPDYILPKYLESEISIDEFENSENSKKNQKKKSKKDQILPFGWCEIYSSTVRCHCTFHGCIRVSS